jgi:hypothetical protein
MVCGLLMVYVAAVAAVAAAIERMATPTARC